MDIYEVEKKEGEYLALEVEHLRKKKPKSHTNIVCDGDDNKQIDKFKRHIILANGVLRIFEQSKAIYVCVEKNMLRMVLVYDTCHIVYSLKEDSDWKVIELDLIDIKQCSEVKANKPDILCREDASVLLEAVNLAYKYGFSRVYNSENPNCLSEMLTHIIEEDGKRRHEPGHADMAASYVLHDSMKKDFIEHMIRSQY